MIDSADINDGSEYINKEAGEVSTTACIDKTRRFGIINSSTPNNLPNQGGFTNNNNNKRIVNTTSSISNHIIKRNLSNSSSLANSKTSV